MIKYLIRLDDACPTMHAKNWKRIEEILDRYNVRPMVGIIPENKDINQKIDKADTCFWEKVKMWDEKSWAIAMHGYDHCFISSAGLSGLNPLWARSEFAGVPVEKQKEKIRMGVEKFRFYGIEPKYFFAPAHTFDENTMKALLEESNIRIISDTIAIKPYRNGDFVFIPQLGGHCVDMNIPGVWTFCLHPSEMTEENFLSTERFIATNIDKMLSFDDLDLSNLNRKNIISRILSFIYFTRRKIKGIQ